MAACKAGQGANHQAVIGKSGCKAYPGLKDFLASRYALPS